MTRSSDLVECDDRGRAPGLFSAEAVAGGLGFAATPAFALMAGLAAIPYGSPTPMLCPPQGGGVLDGMAPMYLLMSAFHLAPWLRLASSAFAVRR